MDDVRAVPASLSGRFSALRSTRNHHRLWGGAAAPTDPLADPRTTPAQTCRVVGVAGTVSMAGDRESSRTATVLAAHELGPA
jgi:hypothetical protein